MMTKTRKPSDYQLRLLREGIERGGTVAGRPNTLASMALAGWVEPTYSPSRSKITEAGRSAAADPAEASPAPADNLPTGTPLVVQMRGVAHRAVETDSGCVCECGAATRDRDALARVHKRSPRVLPGVFEATYGTDGVR